MHEHAAAAGAAFSGTRAQRAFSFGHPAWAVGGMFWFSRNTFVGS